MWTAIIAGGAALAGGALQADSARKASNAQTDASGRAIAQSDRQFSLSRDDLAPYRSAGSASLNKLRAGLGIQPGASGPVTQGYTGNLVDNRNGVPAPNTELYASDPGYRKAWDDFAAVHQQMFNSGFTSASDVNAIEREVRSRLPQNAPAGSVQDTGEFGDAPLTRKFTTEDMQDDPVMKASFDFGLSEGEKAVKRMFGSRGLSRSGAAVKAASRFATDYTGSKAGESRARFVEDQNNTFAKLSGVAGTGQAATTSTAGLGANNANTNAGILTAEGNARGAASIAQGNAYSGALNNIGNNAMGQYTLNRIINNGRQPFTVDTPQVQPQVSGQFNLDTYG